MGLVIGLLILISPVLLALVIHLFREVRGKARNKKACCFACGAPYSDSKSRVVWHYKSGFYGYCERCANHHELWSGIALFAMLLCVAATLAVLSISTFDTNPQKSLIMAGIALTIIVFLALLIVRFIILKRRKRKAAK